MLGILKENISPRFVSILPPPKQSPDLYHAVFIAAIKNYITH